MAENNLFEWNYTPLRQFIDYIGLDYTKLSNRQIRNISKTKRYKMFLAQYKIKAMLNHMHLSDDIFEIHKYTLLREFYYDDIFSNLITEKEVLSILPILERYSKIHRGKYKTTSQRFQIYKNKLLSNLYSGGKISGEGEIMYKGLGKMAKHSHLALSKDRTMILKRKERKSGETYYHRVTLPHVKPPAIRKPK